MGENAEPLTMLRIRNAESFRIPWIFSRMGKWRGEMFIGKLDGTCGTVQSMVAGTEDHDCGDTEPGVRVLADNRVCRRRTRARE